MAIEFLATGDTGLSLAVMVRQITAAGALGDRWDDVSQLWLAAPSDTNKKIAMTEGSGAEAGLYHAARTALGTYTGKAMVYVVDNAVGYSVGHAPVYLESGSESQTGALIASIALKALEATSTAIKAKTDLIVTGGALEASVQTTITNTNTLTTRLTATRAGFLDNLPNLDAAITTRSAPGSLATLDATGRTAIVTAIDAQSVKLIAIHAKLPTKAFLAGTIQADGDIDMDEVIGDRTQWQADITTLATAAALTAVAGNVTSVLADTNELQTDWANMGRLDTLLDTAAAGGGGGGLTAAQVVTAMDADSVKLGAIHGKLPTALFLTGTSSAAGAINLDAAIGDKGAFKADVSALATAAALTTVGGNVTSILADTAELQADWVNGGRLDLILDSVQADTNDLQATLVSILADTNEIQGDLTNGGRLDLLIDAILADTNEVQTDLANLGRLDTIFDAILADTSELQTDWANGGRLDLLIDSILADTNEVQTDLADLGRIDVILDSILADTSELQTDIANGGRVDLLIDAILADTNELQVDWLNGGRLDQLLDIAAGGGIAVSFSERTPTRDRTWVIRTAGESPLASNIITVAAGSSVLVAMDFTRLLPPDVGLLTADSAVDQTNPSFITITELDRSGDADSAIFMVSGLTAGKSHKIKVTVTTTDNQQLVAYGLLEAV